MILFLFKFPSPSLSQIKIQFALVNCASLEHLWTIMDRCKYLLPITKWMVEMPINSGEYHQTIASLWISHLVDDRPLTQVMLAHIASAQLTNPRQITSQQGNIPHFCHTVSGHVTLSLLKSHLSTSYNIHTDLLLENSHFIISFFESVSHHIYHF